MISKTLFSLATLVMLWGMLQNVKFESAIGSLGASSMNSFYLLAVVLYVAAAAAELIWGRGRAAE